LAQNAPEAGYPPVRARRPSEHCAEINARVSIAVVFDENMAIRLETVFMMAS
jgi:hypothetical protein